MRTCGSVPDTRLFFNKVKKYLIAGLGNIGSEYQDTRHNIGFMILDTLAEKQSVSFSTDKLAFRAEFSVKGRQIVLIKPTTYMNLSGKAVRYWMDKEKIELENLLVVNDDLALEFGTIRLKGSGSDGGHNGLKDINQMLGTQNYARLRFGIGNDFPKGRQVDYVLGKWTLDQMEKMPERLDKASEAILSFVLAGLSLTMNQFNGK